MKLSLTQQETNLSEYCIKKENEEEEESIRRRD